MLSFVQPQPSVVTSFATAACRRYHYTSARDHAASISFQHHSNTNQHRPSLSLYCHIPSRYPYHCPFFPCLLRYFQHCSSPTPLQLRHQRCPHFIFSIGSDNSYSHRSPSFPFFHYHPSPAYGSSTTILDSHLVWRYQRAFNWLRILLPCTIVIFVPTHRYHPVLQPPLLLPSSSLSLTNCCFLTRSHYFLSMTLPLPSTLVVPSSSFVPNYSHLHQQQPPLTSPFSMTATAAFNHHHRLLCNRCWYLLVSQPP
ncbi:hypothetical protein B296_00053042 [Ensete ventricosum]|uniref:Uncharacterized protein n=1 Tax=Ensete ventricosum TaxID=4639 RepID=A0A426XLH1_ENSVE|nr:hypothetical protein B296_00053042 [Ensete ventricosum]